jgi:hypothetical protein
MAPTDPIGPIWLYFGHIWPPISDNGPLLSSLAVIGTTYGTLMGPPGPLMPPLAPLGPPKTHIGISGKYIGAGYDGEKIYWYCQK